MRMHKGRRFERRKYVGHKIAEQGVGDVKRTRTDEWAVGKRAEGIIG